jgi:arabinogalactan endo-1,4-beta-galactosidase
MNSDHGPAGGAGHAAEGGAGAAGRVAPTSGGAGASAAGGVGGSSGKPAPGASAASASGSSGVSGAGSPAGGAPAAGSGSPAFRASYFLGADISDQAPAPAEARAKLLTSMTAHGFNYVRLRTFVDPKASDGYDKKDGYGDLAHTLEFAQQIKAAGFGVLLDFHYSDNWADPGKQCVPIAWQKHTNIADLASALHDYTRDAIAQLVAAGARPDMVQIGNEITPGMLLHRCDSGGQPSGDNPVTGSVSNWPNLGALLQAGVTGVKEVDPTILIALHIDRGGDKAGESPGTALRASSNWITNARKYVSFDAFGESCYQRYQGDPASPANSKATWTSTLGGLSQTFPDLEFFAAEYGPAQREINDVLFGLANQRGIGTFNWEPTTQGDWNTGHDLWRRAGNTYAEQPDLALYDQMKKDYASRL